MCSWDLCSQACYGRKPSDDDSEKVSHYVLLVAMFALTVPCCHVFGWLFEEYLIAPVPPAILECLGYEVEEPNFAPVEKDWDPRERKALEDRSPEEASDDTITSVKIQFDATHEAGDGAGVGGAPPAPDADAATLRCSRCLDARYCDAACQRAAWPAHGPTCRAPEAVCGHCGNPGAALRCSRCLGVKYCGLACQTAHWPQHRRECKVPAMEPAEERALILSDLRTLLDDVEGEPLLLAAADAADNQRSILEKIAGEDDFSAVEAALNKEDDGEDEDAIDWVGDLATSLEAANGAWLNRDKVRTPGKSPGRSAGRAMRRSITASKSVMKRSMSAGASLFKGGSDEDVDALAPLVADAVRARCAELSYYATKADQSTRKDARRAASLLRARKDELMGTWGWVPGDASGFEAAVRARVRKQLTRAREWDEELNEAEDAAAKEHCFAGHVRHQSMKSHDHAVAGACADRLDEEMEAPDEAPEARHYVAAWAAMCAFALALYFAVMKPLVVGIYYVLIPSLVLTKVQSSLAIFDDGGDAVPYATLVPSSAAYYLLAMHPELRGTRAGARVLGGDGAAKRPTVDDVIDGLHDSDRRASHVAQDVMLVWVAFFFSFSEDIQDTIVEEVVAFFPPSWGPSCRRSRSPARAAARPRPWA
ncbi:hypothetical protein JL722_12654 [Aureococcus anophagefferens]|nr:hypothetical protein JL722_12654 [Aureococcus anophagefferens]